MTLDDAIADITSRISAVSSSAVIRVMRTSDEEASIRAYAPAADGESIKEATREQTFQLLTNEGLDVQVIFYDVAQHLPPEEE
jgi:hypothetical protein